MPLQLLDKMPLSNRLRKRPPTQPRARKCHRTKPAKIPLASVAAADLLIGVACALGPTKAALAESRPPADLDVPIEYSEIWPTNTSQEEQLLGELGDDYKVFRGADFVIAHSHRFLTVPYRAAIMESVYDSFVISLPNGDSCWRDRTCLSQVVLLPTHEELADATGVPDLPQDVDGLYLYKGGRAYFFDALGRSEVRAIEENNRKSKSELKKLGRKVARSTDSSKWTLKSKVSPGRRYSKRKALPEIDRQLRQHKRESIHWARDAGF